MGLDLHKRTYFLVTGASRGIGQTMAVQVAAKLKPNSTIVLIARNAEGLAETKKDIDDKTDKKHKVLTYSIDLGNAGAEQFRDLLMESLAVSQGEKLNFERAFIIHNAGTVGDVSKRAIDVSDVTTWTKYYHMNLFSAVSLNSEFFRLFADVPKLVVNISSKCGIEPFASMSFYCSAKAARDMFFRVLAVEEDSENTLVLNYAPGAIDTDMTVKVQRETINKELAKSFHQQRASNTMLTTSQTTEEFLRVLEEKEFKSGDHVDYWD